MPRYRVNGHTVTVPYGEEEYRQILANSGTGLTLQGVIAEPSMYSAPLLAGMAPSFVSTGPAGRIGGQVLGGLARGAVGLLGGLLGGEEGQDEPGGGYIPAPRAGIITGDCPPGRVRRRVAWGRDICARKPRMNVTNVRALRRAMKRVTGFAKVAKSTIQFTKRVKMKKKRSSRCST